MKFEGNCRATGIGSLPFQDVDEALELVFVSAPDLPFLPQLPKRSPNEGMNEQVSENLPGLRWVDGKMTVVRDDAFFVAAEELLGKRDAEDSTAGAISADHAAAFDPFLAAVRQNNPSEAKGQISGPITFGMAILDETGTPILYDDFMRDLIVRHLWLKVKWQSERIAAAGCAPVIFIDEPFLASFGTAFFGWKAEDVRRTLEEVYSAAPVTGTHCCANTDWSIFFQSSVDIISFDAFSFAEKFFLYLEDLHTFLNRGGNIAWGIVPTDPDEVARVSTKELADRLSQLMDQATRCGIQRDQILRQSLITPACGLGTRPPDTARRATELARDVAAAIALANP